MPELKGGLFITFEPGRSQILQEAAKERNRFSVELSASDWEHGHKEMFLISFSRDRKSIECAALGRRKSGGARNTGAYNVEFTDFVFFDPISLLSLLKRLPERMQATVREREGTRGKWFPPMAWETLLTQLKAERPLVESQLDQLWAHVNAHDQVALDNQAQRLAFQRDAIGLSLDIAGLSEFRRQKFRKIHTVDMAAGTDSFIKLMDAQPPQERMLIDHDRSIFESVIAKGEAESAIFSEGFRNLRVWTVDRGRLERFAGIDLVILNCDYNSLLLLQYKCMESEHVEGTNQWRYRPDDQFNSEICRMENVNKLIQQCSSEKLLMEDIRLDNGALYFKFCKRLPLSQQDGELAEGMLMSLTSTERFFKSEAAKGPRKGQYIGYENCERYLSNSLFSALARDGWIGSQGLGNERYKEILGFLQKEEDRSLVLAESRTIVPSGAPRTARRPRFSR